MNKALCLTAIFGVCVEFPSDARTRAVIDVQEAVEDGLHYLESTQEDSGAWRAGAGYPTSMTSLAGMAFLGAGSTLTRGEYAGRLRRATMFLLDVAHARNDGLIATPGEASMSMHGHGFATLFLSQVYGMEEARERELELKDVLTKAVELISLSQSDAGGWYYTPESRNDEGSVTITQVQALRACRDAGIYVPKTTVDRAVEYIRSSANPDGGIRYRVSGGGPGRPAITAAAVVVLDNAGEHGSEIQGIADQALGFALSTLSIHGSGQSHHYYAHLYLAQALYKRGGVDWDDYYARISRWLVEGSRQRPDGSWEGDDVGPVYGTAIALTILQLPKALVPIYQR